MKRLSLTTWLLLATVALLGGYVYFGEVRGGEREAKRQEATTKLLPFKPEAATEVVLDRKSGRVDCRKEGGQWTLEQPLHTQADDLTISKLVEDVATAKVDRTLPASESQLASYGLVNPQRIIVGAGLARQELEIGKANPTDQYVFVRKPGQPRVLLADKKVLNALDRPLYDLREKTLFAFVPEDVTSILFRSYPSISGNPSVPRPRSPVFLHQVRLTRATGPASWKMVKPLKVTADRGRVERSLDLLSGLRAEAFISDNPADAPKYGLAPPLEYARFQLKDGKEETLLIGKRTVDGALTRYFAMRPGGPIVTINDNLPRDAEEPPSEWREKHIVDFATADVAELRLIMPDHAVVCVKTQGPNGDEWKMAEYAGKVAEGMSLGAAAKLPTAKQADPERVKDLLGRFATLQADGFRESERASGRAGERATPDSGLTTHDSRLTTLQTGLQNPSLKVVVLDAKGQELASASFGAQVGRDFYGTSPHLGCLFTIPATDIARFRAGLADLTAR